MVITLPSIMLNHPNADANDRWKNEHEFQELKGFLSVFDCIQLSFFGSGIAMEALVPISLELASHDWK
jgi:hypothetical protein